MIGIIGTTWMLCAFLQYALS